MALEKMQLAYLAQSAHRFLQQNMAESLYLGMGIDMTRPLAIRGTINQQCNYKCQYCRFWRLPNYKPEITIEQWQAALKSLQEFIGKYTIQFSGGEPFIKPGFTDLLSFCHQNDIQWGVITNGSAFSHHMVQQVVAAHPVNIDISVDSPVAEVHDTVRGIPGSLKQITKGIRRLREERDRQGLSFPIRIKPTVHIHNFRELPQFVHWIKDAGATVIDFSPVRPHTAEVESDLWIRDPADIAILEEVSQTLIAMKQRGEPIETSTEKLESMPAHFRGELVYVGVSPCRAGLRDYHIKSDGTVSMCWFYPKIGNVVHQSARNIWYGEKARELRAQMVACQKFGTLDCANSCLTHRTINQQIRRGMYFLRQAG